MDNPRACPPATARAAQSCCWLAPGQRPTRKPLDPQTPHGTRSFVRTSERCHGVTCRHGQSPETAQPNFVQKEHDGQPCRAEGQILTPGSCQEKPKVSGPALLSAGLISLSRRWAIPFLTDIRFMTTSRFAGKAPNFLSKFFNFCGGKVKKKKGCFLVSWLPSRAERKQLPILRDYFLQEISIFLFFSPPPKDHVLLKFSRGRGRGTLVAGSEVLLILCTYKMETLLPGGISGILFL